ncbi:MAG: ABC transporter ATP-binding protein [Anaeromicrobium sp.]|jgi:simple sugar transport system ATP-binding protein|uniref:ABC transporter ATP-binding protein n=1 Tax=Anaeromicrobium sp. TaxID=1929132 RepID=UPI0025DCC810|nr:ABC transporter ATP-binding protein [Anaeromicrobium sp.]MCT4594017.1 ABC transporter ATP-binding protein [Anaeromicrobium sp.]
MSKYSFSPNEEMVEMKKITKKFGNFIANDAVDLEVYKGEIHALLGENGAGKSTLMNILYGLYTPTGGSIKIGGKEVKITSPKVAIEYGIGMVHQHFMLIPVFTVLENIMLGCESTVYGSFIDKETVRENLIKLSKEYGLDVDPDMVVADLSVGMQQRIEILKALYKGADVLILDEPTAVLTPQEIDSLIEIIKNLGKMGKSIIIITHKLKEILAVADRCTVIRTGKKIGVVNVSDTNEKELASMMVGREVEFKVKKEKYKPGKVSLEIRDLVVVDNREQEAVNKLNLQAYEGEILGIAGIDGNGQKELIEGVFGLTNIKSGEIKINGQPIQNENINSRQHVGLCLIPEDRHKHGLVLDFSIYENFILNDYKNPKFSKNSILNINNIKEFSKKMVEKFDIRLNHIEDRAAVLSGGNQQKIIIAREVTNNPNVLIAAQPTRGLDVGAIEFVHKALVDQRNKGKTVILVSYELDEIMSLSDRIAVIYEGEIVGIYKGSEVDEYRLGLLMSGGDK